jgi:hypothetical protein
MTTSPFFLPIDVHTYKHRVLKAAAIIIVVVVVGISVAAAAAAARAAEAAGINRTRSNIKNAAVGQQVTVGVYMHKSSTRSARTTR